MGVDARSHGDSPQRAYNLISFCAAPTAQNLRERLAVLGKRMSSATGLWERYLTALDEVTERLERITSALDKAQVEHALVGGQAVALWVATKDPAAVRTTKDADILLRPEDLPRARAAAASVALDYFEVMGVGMLLERSDPNPRKAVRLLWSGERVRPEYRLPSPTVDERVTLEPGKHVVSLNGLVRMKLMANRD
jgi:hypothetical protein